VAQEVLKGITQKFKPIHSAFYLDFSELLPKEPTEWSQAQLSEIYTPAETRDEGFAQVVGRKLALRVKEAKLFMVGAGAIGC
jgi:ubiquitin-activating enzyme E1